eukprot:2930835-Ditylum_brightwellii.AAC.1
MTLPIPSDVIQQVNTLAWHNPESISFQTKHREDIEVINKDIDEINDKVIQHKSNLARVEYEETNNGDSKYLPSDGRDSDTTKVKIQQESDL